LKTNTKKSKKSKTTTIKLVDKSAILQYGITAFRGCIRDWRWRFL